MADGSSSFMWNKWRHHDITACLKIIKMLTNFLILSDTSLFIKYFSLYGHLEEFLDFANKFKTVT